MRNLSRKILQTRNITERLSFLIASLADGKHTVFAKKAGIPISTFQAYINKGRPPHLEHLLRIHEIFSVDINWLVTGEGHPFIKKVEPSAIDPDPEINEMLEMTRAVITSNTGFAHSLKANIRSFYDAVETQNKLDQLEQRISEVEKQQSGGGNTGTDGPIPSTAPK